MLTVANEAARRSASSGLFDFATLLQLTAGGRGNPVHVACPLCGPNRLSAANRRRRVLAIWINHGFASYFCVRCSLHGWAREGGSTGRGSMAGRPRAERGADEHAEAESKRRAALALWREAMPIAGTLAAKYLARRRLEPPPDASECLRGFTRMRRSVASGIRASLRSCAT
jgi:hypothetical protein